MSIAMSIPDVLLLTLLAGAYRYAGDACRNVKSASPIRKPHHYLHQVKYFSQGQ